MEKDPERLPRSPHQRLDSLLRTAERLWGERPDVREAIGSLQSADFWYWFMWHGPNEYPAVRDGLYPMPPPELMNRVVGEVGSDAYRHSGLVNFRRLHMCLEEAGMDFSRRGTRILDFGCGCGRILQFFAFYADRCSLHGADVDEQAVAWCNKEFDFADFDSLPKKPPSQLASADFDAVYAYSVFSHLPEELHLAWLRELHRITKPGAAVVLTTMGMHCMRELASGAKPGAFPSAEVVAADLERCARDGFRFYPYSGFGQRRLDSDVFSALDVEQYGSTFILPSYVKARWLDLFDLVAIHEAPDDWQDYIVLKRRP